MAYGIFNPNILVNGPFTDDKDLLCVFTVPLTLKSNQPAFVQDTLSLRRIAASQNTQRWELITNIAPTIGGSIMTHQTRFGHYGVFLIRTPQPAGLVCSPNGVFVTSPHPARSTVINFSTTMKPGEFIRFNGSDTKVYQIQRVSGNAAVIFPSLRKDLSVDTQVMTDQRVAMSVRYNADVTLGMIYTDGMLNDPGSVAFIEALS